MGETIHKFLFGLEFERPTTIVEFDYRMGIVRSRSMIRDLDPWDQRRELVR